MVDTRIASLLWALYERNTPILQAKNKDYRGGDSDPFSNFRKSTALGVPVQTGIMLRMIDKHQRIRAFILNGVLAVKGESVLDAILDLHNYTCLIYGFEKSVKNFEQLVAHREHLYHLTLPLLDAGDDDVLGLLDKIESIMASRADCLTLLAMYTKLADALDKRLSCTLLEAK